MRFVVLTDNYTEAERGAEVEFDLEDADEAGRAQALMEAGVIEPDAGSAEDGSPAPSAKKPVWVDWAVAHGADRDEAEAKTVKELIAEYGSHA